ncbi:MAG: hypothetical protein ACI9EF_001730 [Pseudohongiellaceae bacterium]|jgi:hypothetical protein
MTADQIFRSRCVTEVVGGGLGQRLLRLKDLLNGSGLRRLRHTGRGASDQTAKAGYGGLTLSAQLIGLPLMLATLLVALASLPLLTGPTAYPIAPVPLRALIERATLIVALDGNEPETLVGSSGSSIVCRLKVLRTRKADGADETVDVALRYSLCPTPASDSVGTRLAFLEPASETNALVSLTVGLSYGAKSISEEDLSVYVVRIEELLELLSQPAGAERDIALAACG